MKRKVFVVTGNTGTGKTSVTKYLNEFYEMPKVVTHTTRQPRAGEMDQVDYYFESHDTFAQNHYLEQVTYDGNQYGSSREGLERAFEKNPLITIVLDTQGAATYLEELPADEVVVIYLTVSKEHDLYQRLVKRGDDVQKFMNVYRVKNTYEIHRFQRIYKHRPMLLKMMTGKKPKTRLMPLCKHPSKMIKD
ncbi:Guanylate kinase [Weissella viridescens]|uniref:Guanylate kinase n=1 Tax=Weissella viridescens TaxID=1629 RepID=A0A380P816_WEIVI|nr:Guanylate kinase [Weissella viridescens]